MAISKTYVVPVDFSKGSEAALKHAVQLAREKKAKLLLLHVISATFAFPLEAGFADIFEALEEDARVGLKKLIQRHVLKPGSYRAVLVRGVEAARVIADQAKKARASMIVMGSHGRTGLERFMLGSVAERTLRYADCPVLIVKK